MKISYNWLREYVDVKNSAKQAAQWLTMAGLEVTSLEEKGKDAVLEIEVTSNRPDWLSVVGVARELSAITGKRLKMPRVPAILPAAVREKQVRVELDDKALCPRYTARVIEGVNVGESPQWLKGRLEAIGARPINNVVDITNFCLFELGQPMHAFDYDKLPGGAVVVRKARAGEEIVTIDNVKRTLDSGMLVIADEKRPVAVAGVMGGRDTEVGEGTKTVLLESAYFDPVSVRRTARRLGLSTDSSYRFERGVDFNGVLFGSNRAARLVSEICNGKIGVLKDAGVKVAKATAVRLSVNKLNRVLNLNLTPVEVKKTLVSLGLKVAGAQEELRVEAPSFRDDLKRQEDLIEEAARIHGYEKIPVTIPRMVGHSERKAFPRMVEEIARDFLAARGFDEIITYSLMDRKALANITPHPTPSPLRGEGWGEGIIALSNPLSSQQEIMRPTLITGALGAAGFNINRKVEDIRIFELSKVYSRGPDKGYAEEPRLCILIAGETKIAWRQPVKADFLRIKGAVEELFEKLGITYYGFCGGAPDIFYPEKSARIEVNGVDVGALGQVNGAVLNNFDIKKDVFACEIRFGELIKFVSIEKKASAPSRFLPARRDISLIVEKNIFVGDLAGAIKTAGGAILSDVQLTDEYFGAQIPPEKRGLAFSVEYLTKDKQLTDEEIESSHSRIKEALVSKFGAVIR
ncbi:MAG: phenylalanine--tRNA ligase subunit beta [Candidatus Omnitrophica bacterium]|nr:phenylalanine--tRNA ligase subunit beta [Candidatus Omnitrophota bacterium]